MSQISKRTKKRHFKTMGDHKKFMSRIKTTLYYGQLPLTDRLSLPLTELAAELFSEAQHGRSLERLHCNDAATISRNACVSPCSLVLALLYLERLKTLNPQYLQRIAPSELFLVSLMVSSKFLHDDGDEDEVFIDEWAASGGISSEELINLEKDFLNAIDWEVFVNELTFWKKLDQIEMDLAKREGSTRGWYTYSELQNLLTLIEASHLVQLLTKVSVVLIATYTAGLLTLFGSMLIASHVPGTHLFSSANSRNAARGGEIVSAAAAAAANSENAAVARSDALNNFTDLESSESFDASKNAIKSSSSNVDATDVLTTSILLASIKSCSNYSTACYLPPEEDGAAAAADVLTSNDSDCAWMWWNNPLMNWLFDSSDAEAAAESVDRSEFEAKFHVNFDKYIDVFIANSKTFELQDQVHKASTVRMQDQLERSWHKEWTDTFQKQLFPLSQFYYRTRTTVS